MTDEIPRNGVSIKGVLQFIKDLTEKTRTLSEGYKGYDPEQYKLRPLHKHELKLIEGKWPRINICWYKPRRCRVCGDEVGGLTTWRSCIECGYDECLQCYQKCMKEYEKHFKCPEDCLDSYDKRLKYYDECLNQSTSTIATLAAEYLTKSTQSTYADLLTDDPKFIGPATIFISHAWGMPFNSLIASIIDLDEKERLRDGSRIPYFWLDVLVNNQHKAGNRPFEWWQTVFKDNVKNIGHTALILEWETPRPLSRVWCVWEMLCSSAETNVRFQVVMPPKSRDAFQQTFIDDFDSLISKTCTIDLRNAESYHGGECLKKNSDGICCEVTAGKITECPNDKARIFQACETAIEGGIEVVSQRVIEMMIDWMIFSGKEIVKIHRRRFGSTHSYTLDSINTMAKFLYTRGKFSEAEPLLVEALEVRRRTLGNKHPDTLMSIINMAACLNARGKYAEAEPLYVEALKVCRRTFGNTNPISFFCINHMAVFLNARGKYAEAEPLYVEALKGLRRTLGNTNPITLASIGSMAVCLNAQGKHAEAEPLYVEALEASRRTLGDTHPDTLRSINSMAVFLNDRGKYTEAEPLFVEALEVRRRTLGDTHQNTFRSMRDYADFLCSRGTSSDLTEAASLSKSALLGLQSSLGESNLASLNALRVHGRVLYLQGFFTDSIQILKQAVVGLQKENDEESLRYAIRDLTAAENALEVKNVNHYKFLKFLKRVKPKKNT